MNHFAQLHPILFGVFLSLGCILVGGGLAFLIFAVTEFVKKYRYLRDRVERLHDERDTWQGRYFTLRDRYLRDIRVQFQQPFEEFAPPALVEPVPFEVQPELPF